MAHINRISTGLPGEKKLRNLKNKKEDNLHIQEKDLLGLIGDKVELSHILGPPTGIAIEKGVSDKIHVGGDVGRTTAHYDITATEKGLHIEGDIGDSWADYNITKTEKGLHVEGDAGKCWVEYDVTKEGEGTHVEGDMGDCWGNFNITKKDNITHVKGDVGNNGADYTVTREGNVTHVKGDLGEKCGDYKVIEEGNITRITGNTGGEQADYTIATEGNVKHIKGDVGDSRAYYKITRGDLKREGEETTGIKTIELVKPELKPAAEKLINKMNEISQKGGGELPVIDVLKLFPGIPPHVAEKIKERGNMHFKSTGPGALIFQNTGKKLDFDIPVGGDEYTLKVPEKIKGLDYCKRDGFTMFFEEDNTVTVGKFILNIGLEKVVVGRDKIFIDFEGEMADTLIKFS